MRKALPVAVAGHVGGRLKRYLEPSVFRNENACDRGFLCCNKRCIPALKLNHAGEHFLAGFS